MKGTTGGGGEGGGAGEILWSRRPKQVERLGQFSRHVALQPSIESGRLLDRLVETPLSSCTFFWIFFSLENKNFCLQEPPGVKQINSGRHRRSPFLENFPLRFFYSAAGNCKGTRVQMLGIFSFDLFQSVVM